MQVVREGNFLGVVAQTEWAAIKAARQLKATLVEMGRTARAGQALRACARDQGVPRRDDRQCRQHRRGDGREGAKKVAATYDFAIHTHGSIRPVLRGRRIPRTASSPSWSASQATHDLRKQLAEMFAMPVENVRCIYLEGSGCYGRNGHEDAAADAALLAKAVGRPVRVQWSRADEHGWDPKGPPTLDRPARGARRLRQRDGLGIGVLHSAADRQELHGAAASRRRWPACRRTPDIAPGNIFQNSEHPLQVRQHQSGLPPAGDDAVPAVLDQDAGPDAEHLRQRVLPRRARGGGRMPTRSSSG